MGEREETIFGFYKFVQVVVAQTRQFNVSTSCDPYLPTPSSEESLAINAVSTVRKMSLVCMYILPWIAVEM